MISAAAVVVCALKVLGRSPSTLPPIALVRGPAGISSAVQGFVRPGPGVISLVTDSEVFEAALDSGCRAYTAIVKLASIIAHEEWHVRYAPTSAEPTQRNSIRSRILVCRFTASST
jgi:hypothetical protein